jgi:hypothetical protein
MSDLLYTKREHAAALVLKAPRRENVWGRGTMAPRIIKVCIGWKLVLTSPPPPRYPLCRKLRGQRSNLEAIKRTNFFCPCRGTNPD